MPISPFLSNSPSMDSAHYLFNHFSLSLSPCHSVPLCFSLSLSLSLSVCVSLSLSLTLFLSFIPSGAVGTQEDYLLGDLSGYRQRYPLPFSSYLLGESLSRIFYITDLAYRIFADETSFSTLRASWLSTLSTAVLTIFGTWEVETDRD